MMFDVFNHLLSSSQCQWSSSTATFVINSSIKYLLISPVCNKKVASQEPRIKNQEEEDDDEVHKPGHLAGLLAVLYQRASWPIMTTSRSVDDLPDGFSLEHDAVQPEVWWNIERWLSSGMLPSIVSDAKYIDGTSHSHASASNTSDTLIHILIPWQEGSQGRKVAQFGSCKYDYVADVALQCDPTINPIPEYIHQTLLKDVPNGNQYTQCIINKYEAENIIPWHLDHEYFGPEVLQWSTTSCPTQVGQIFS